MRLLWLFFLFLYSLAFAQREVLRVGDGVSSPKLIHQVEPSYSIEAQSAGIQGAVVMGVVINEKGELEDIEFLSPLGFGLDEEALKAIKQWRFSPGLKDDKPVPVYCTIEINFRFKGRFTDTAMEKQRTAFNIALKTLGKDNPKNKADAIEAIQKLANDNYPRAQALLGTYYLTGQELPIDEVKGVQLLQAAASKKDSFALAKLGKMYVKGELVEKDQDRGIKMLQQGSVLGSSTAQFYLGSIYAEGDGITKDLAFAKRQFRLCATNGDAACQYQLGKLMLVDGALERDRIQALAWLDLASKTYPGATIIAAAAKAKLTPTQIQWAENLKLQLLRKQ